MHIVRNATMHKMPIFLKVQKSTFLIRFHVVCSAFQCFIFTCLPYFNEVKKLFVNFGHTNSYKKFYAKNVEKLDVNLNISGANHLQVYSFTPKLSS